MTEIEDMYNSLQENLVNDFNNKINTGKISTEHEIQLFTLLLGIMIHFSSLPSVQTAHASSALEKMRETLENIKRLNKEAGDGQNATDDKDTGGNDDK